MLVSIDEVKKHLLNSELSQTDLRNRSVIGLFDILDSEN
jgi:hypothetical protein